MRHLPGFRKWLMGLFCLLITGVLGAQEPKNPEDISWQEAQERAEASTGTEKEKWEKLYRTRLLEKKHGGKEFYAEYQKERVIWKRGYGNLLGVFKLQTQLALRLVDAKIEEVEAQYAKTRDEALIRQRKMIEEKTDTVYRRYREVYWPLLLGLAPSEKGESLDTQAKIFYESNREASEPKGLTLDMMRTT